MKQLFKWISIITPYVVVCIFLFITFSLFSCNDFITSKLFLGLVALLTALIPLNYYYISTASLEFQSFTNCNRRFDKMNELLNQIDINYKSYNKSDPKLDEKIEFSNINKSTEQIILDYLDLCAEEYYLYKYSGIISRKVWKHWLNGMLYYFNKDNLFYIVIIKEEPKEGSYYDFIEFIIKEILKHK